VSCLKKLAPIASGATGRRGTETQTRRVYVLKPVETAEFTRGICCSKSLTKHLLFPTSGTPAGVRAMRNQYSGALVFTAHGWNGSAPATSVWAWATTPIIRPELANFGKKVCTFQRIDSTSLCLRERGASSRTERLLDQRPGWLRVSG